MLYCPNLTVHRSFRLRSHATRAALVGSIVLTAACGDSLTGPKAVSAPAGLQRTLDSIVLASELPGAIVTVRLANGDSYTLTSGVADLGTRRPIAANDHVRIGSITKAMVAAVVLSLVDEGRVALDRPISTYLPGVYANAERITVRQLLNHTAGLPNYTDDERFLADIINDPTRDWSPEQLLAVASRSPVAFEPGSPGRWAYSNTGYTLLGMIVERVTGRSLAQELASRVFSKAGMSATSFPTSSGLPTPFAEGYLDLSDDQVNVPVGALLNPSWAGAAGAVVSTTADLARFVEAMAAGKLFSAASLSAQQQSAAGSQVRFPGDDLDETYGLGAMLYDGWIGHNGAIPGYEAEAHAKPGVGAIAVAINRTAPDPTTTRAIFAAVRSAQFGR